eukprot:10209220-Ditylum_brightwellii.AAC.1
MALKTGGVCNTNRFLEIPLTNDIIERVETMTKQQINKEVFKPGSMLLYELQGRLGFQEDTFDDDVQTGANDDNDGNMVEDAEIQEPAPLMVVPGGVNIIDDSDNNSTDDD